MALSVPKFLLASALALLGGVAAAQAPYPSRPVRIVVPTPPGPLDTFARQLAERLAEQLRQPFVVENRPGAGGNLGATAVARSPADGYTLMLAIDTTLTVNPHLYASLQFSPANDFSIVALPVSFGQMLAVHPSVPANSVAELIAQARRKSLSYASGGNGSPTHLAFAYFLASAGIEALHVPHKGGQEAVLATVAGTTDAVFTVTTAVNPQAQAGRLRALAVSTPQRSVLAPSVPTVAESGFPGFAVQFGYVLAAPRGTPEAIVERLAAEVDVAMRHPQMREHARAADYGIEPLRGEQAADWLAQARERWGRVIRDARIRID